MQIKLWPIPHFLLILFLPNFASAFCPPGCECNDQLLSVECDYGGLTSIPILLNPMLKSLTIRNSNGLKMDTFSIALYQELESLELSANQIGQIPVDFLAPLAKLRRLNFRGNKLRRLEPKMFDKMAALEALDLSSNQIDRLLPGTLDPLPNLLALNLSSNLLYSFPPNSFPQKLRILNLASNRFAKLPQSFAAENVQNELEELNLAGNIISELTPNAFSACPKLHKLDLGANLISHIEEGAFKGMGALREMNLAQNLLATPYARGGDGMEKEVARQNWAKLPAALEKLDLSRNSWAQIPANIFADANSLKELLLEEMSQLREIGENAFAGLLHLERVSLANSNFLAQIHENAFGTQNGDGTKIVHLDLTNCLLSSISPQLLPKGQWKRMKTLKLNGNRWECECRLMAFLPAVLETLQKGQGQFVGGALCAGPEMVSGQPIVEVAKQNLPEFAQCPPSSSTISAGKIFMRENFVWIASGAAFLLLLSSSVLLFLMIFCCCQKGGGKAHFCCSNRRENGLKKEQQMGGRVQLYSTGSTFTESLIYEKGVPPFSASSSSAINGGGTIPTGNSLIAIGGHTNRSSSKFYAFGAGIPSAAGTNRILIEQQKSPSMSDESNGTENSQNFQQNSQTFDEGGTTNSNDGGDEYYSSIMLDSLYEEQYHHSPPDSPPPPPPPILSDPPNWPPPNLMPPIGVPLRCCQMAAPPYQIRAATKNSTICSVDPAYYGRNMEAERRRRQQ